MPGVVRQRPQRGGPLLSRSTSGNAVGTADGQSPPGFSRDQEGGLSCPPFFFFFEEKNHDVQPPSFEFTQRSEEGAKNDAPP